MYEYSATLVDNYDGDTLTVDTVLMPDEWVDLGFGIRKNFYQLERMKLRLYGVNAPEIKDPGPAGEDARDWVKKWFTDNCPGGVFTLNTFATSSKNTEDKDDKYGRYLAIVTAPNGRRLNDDLISTGHGVPYMVT
jgi:endonuclease YncB( thermonuclease family)